MAVLYYRGASSHVDADPNPGSYAYAEPRTETLV
jgi:hypothetical protein